MDKSKKFIDVKQMPLEEWLNILFNPPSGTQFITTGFPTDKHLQEYIANIDQRSDDDVYRLLRRFLISSGTMPHDKMNLQILRTLQKNRDENSSPIFSEYDRRLILYSVGKSQVPPWEGITWILDLLPHFPKQALEGINAYLLSHAQILPDWRYTGLQDASVVIRAKFIGMPGNQSEKVLLLQELPPRDFEHLIERLYREMEYETQLTKAQKDGGRDVIAIKNHPGKREHLLIECKRYTGSVGVSIVRGLLGVVSDEKVNKGVIVTSGRFTKPAQDFTKRNPRLELIDGQQLVLLMNEFLGPKWPLHIERLIMESQKAS